MHSSAVRKVIHTALTEACDPHWQDTRSGATMPPVINHFATRLSTSIASARHMRLMGHHVQPRWSDARLARAEARRKPTSNSSCSV